MNKYTFLDPNKGATVYFHLKCKTRGHFKDMSLGGDNGRLRVQQEQSLFIVIA